MILRGLGGFSVQLCAACVGECASCVAVCIGGSAMSLLSAQVCVCEREREQGAGGDGSWHRASPVWG